MSFAYLVQYAPHHIYEIKSTQTPSNYSSILDKKVDPVYVFKIAILD